MVRSTGRDEAPVPVYIFNVLSVLLRTGPLGGVFDNRVVGGHAGNFWRVGIRRGGERNLEIK
jgi:hypothetical protein